MRRATPRGRAMPELSDELRRELQAAGGEPLRLTDPVTQQEYVLVRADQYEAVTPARPTYIEFFDIPEGVQLSKAALRRDLPGLLASWWKRGKWVCYHRDERIGIHRDYFALIQELNRRNIPDGEYFID